MNALPIEARRKDGQTVQMVVCVSNESRYGKSGHGADAIVEMYSDSGWRAGSYYLGTLAGSPGFYGRGLDGSGLALWADSYAIKAAELERLVRWAAEREGVAL